MSGNPLVNQRDNAKDKDRKTTKAPSCGALVLLFLFQQPGAGPPLPPAYRPGLRSGQSRRDKQPQPIQPSSWSRNAVRV